MLNQITICGKMVKDAEDRMLNSGKCMTTFTVAVSRNYKNSNGEYDADFIDCVAFDKTGEIVSKYFHKGDTILLVGELQAKLYEDQQGVKRKQYVVLVARTFFTSKKNPASEA